MERERKFKIVALVAVIIAVIGLSIAFAAMSRTLNINGRGNVDPANFDIYFTNLSQPTLKGEASVSGTPTLATKGVTISNMNVTLKKPNDSVVYTVDIKNDGDIDAEIENLVLPTFTSAQQELFDFTVVYTNGGQAVSIGDTLAKGETRNVTITFKYKDITDESLLPSAAQQISLSYQIIYKQTNSIVTTTTQGSQYGSEIDSTSLGNEITATYYGGTPMAKSETGIVQMSNNIADDTRYQGGTLVVSGIGAMTDNEEINAELLMFLAGVTAMEELMEKFDPETETLILKYNPLNLVIEEGITKIGDYSFAMISSITNVQLSSTITSIGCGAFEQTSLTTVNVPSSVKSIGSTAFLGSNLTNVTLNEGLETIGEDAFADFKGVSITIPSTVTSLGGLLFESSETLSEIYISGSNFTVENGTFGYINNDNVTVYCKTQAGYNIINALPNGSNIHVMLDATKFN